MSKVYQHLKTEKRKSIIKNGFRAAGITDIVTQVCIGNILTVDPCVKTGCTRINVLTIIMTMIIFASLFDFVLC